MMKTNIRKSDAIVIGWINHGKTADCGETMKNQLMINRLTELGVNCHIVDIKGWRKRPWVFLQLLWFLIRYKKDTIIFSSTATNTYPMMKLMYRLGWKQKTVHWVIGGLFGERVKSGFFNRDVIKIINHTLVESPQMKEELDECGISDVRIVPNFKPIDYIPDISWRKGPISNRKIKFVYLSRIIPQKGCDVILDAVNTLNDVGLGNSFEVDFYGKIDEVYEVHFKQRVSELKNVRYSGFLNLREKKGYDILSKYDMMLFPTFWPGEGFAGIFIDAHISGLPIIATDWMHNRYFLKEGKTATFISPHSSTELSNKMKSCIEGKYDLYKMAQECQKEAFYYDVKNVITTKLLQDICIF